jgi:hypothetical protein
MITHTKELIKIPVVIQTRKYLNGKNKGTTLDILIFCKYIEDVIKYKRLYTSPDYEVLDARIEVRRIECIENTYEEGAQ